MITVDKVHEDTQAPPRLLELSRMLRFEGCAQVTGLETLFGDVVDEMPRQKEGAGGWEL